MAKKSAFASLQAGKRAMHSKYYAGRRSGPTIVGKLFLWMSLQSEQEVTIRSE